MSLMVGAVSFKAASKVTASGAALPNATAPTAIDTASVEEVKLAISAGVAPASNIEEPLVVLRRRFVEHMDRNAVHKGKSDPTENDYDAAEAEAAAADKIREESFDLHALTPEEALACLDWAREEFGGYYVKEHECPDWMNVWTLKMLDSSFAVFRHMVAERVA